MKGMRKEPEAFSTLLNGESFKCLLAILLQQLTVASSTIFIVNLVQSVESSSGFSYKYFILFLLSLILVYVPNCFAEYYKCSARVRAIKNYIELFISRNFARTSVGNRQVRRRYEPWLTSECLVVYEETVEVLFHALQMLGNVVLSVITLGMVLSSSLLYGYLGASVVILIASRSSNGLLQNSSRQVQEARKQLAADLLLIWENVFVGNRYNLDKWRSGFAASLTAVRKALARYSLSRALIASGTTILALLCIFSALAGYIYQNIDNRLILTAVIVTLPRQVQIFQSILGFFDYLLQWKGISARLAGLSQPLAIPEFSSMEHIRWDEISIIRNDTPLNYGLVKEFVNSLENAHCGRYTLRGKNGSGKSTLLAHLAETLGGHSYYLPASYGDLVFADSTLPSASDGQRMVRVLQEINSLSEIKLLLLDEWDANLDTYNRLTIDKKLAELSQEKVVVEVRHFA
jgi:hypothetical protein